MYLNHSLFTKRVDWGNFNKFFNQLNTADNCFANSPCFHKRPETIYMYKEMKSIPIGPVLALIDNTNESYHKLLYISVFSPAHYCAQWFVPWKQFFPQSLRH